MDSTLILNPLDCEIKINPIASAEVETKPIAVSPSILLVLIKNLIKIDASIAIGMAIYKGLLLKSTPITTPVKLMWAKPSPIKDWFELTKKFEIKDVDTAKVTPIKIALIMKG